MSLPARGQQNARARRNPASWIGKRTTIVLDTRDYALMVRFAFLRPSCLAFVDRGEVEDKWGEKEKENQTSGH